MNGGKAALVGLGVLALSVMLMTFGLIDSIWPLRLLGIAGFLIATGFIWNTWECFNENK